MPVNVQTSKKLTRRLFANVFFEASIILIPKSHKDITKENYRLVSFMNIDVIVPKKMLQNQIHHNWDLVREVTSLKAYPESGLWPFLASLSAC